VTAQPTNMPTLVPLTVQLVPRDGPGITPSDWEARAKRLAEMLAEDEFPPDDLPNTLRELSLRDEIGWSWCYDGSMWWVWDGTAWTNRMPTGNLQLLPFTMETQVEEEAPTPAPARRFVPTHRVPGAGMPAWSRPDPSLQPEHTLAGGLDVMVTEQRADGWAHVAFSNDWEAWVDGRLLVAVTA
jgi:hypothetical protein